MEIEQYDLSEVQSVQSESTYDSIYSLKSDDQLQDHFKFLKQFQNYDQIREKIHLLKYPAQMTYIKVAIQLRETKKGRESYKNLFYKKVNNDYEIMDSEEEEKQEEENEEEKDKQKQKQKEEKEKEKKREQIKQKRQSLSEQKNYKIKINKLSKFSFPTFHKKETILSPLSHKDLFKSTTNNLNIKSSDKKYFTQPKIIFQNSVQKRFSDQKNQNQNLNGRKKVKSDDKQ